MVCADVLLLVSRAYFWLHDWAQLAQFSPRVHTRPQYVKWIHYIVYVLLCGFLVHRTVVKCWFVLAWR